MTVGQLRWNKVLKSRGQNFFASQSFFYPILLDRKKNFQVGRPSRDGEFFRFFFKVTHFLPPSPAQEEIFRGDRDGGFFHIPFASHSFFTHSPGEEENFSRG